jgi:hypothetical protein
MSEDNYHNPQHKFIAVDKKLNSAMTSDTAKVNAHKLCYCPSSEPGKINMDIYAHCPGCRIRKRLQTGKFTINTSVTPDKFSDGCSLAVAIGAEDY